MERQLVAGNVYVVKKAFRGGVKMFEQGLKLRFVREHFSAYDSAPMFSFESVDGRSEYEWYLDRFQDRDVVWDMLMPLESASGDS